MKSISRGNVGLEDWSPRANPLLSFKTKICPSRRKHGYCCYPRHARASSGGKGEQRHKKKKAAQPPPTGLPLVRVSACACLRRPMSAASASTAVGEMRWFVTASAPATLPMALASANVRPTYGSRARRMPPSIVPPKRRVSPSARGMRPGWKACTAAGDGGRPEAAAR